jgi:plasmid stabilization system protein ParE
MDDQSPTAQRVVRLTEAAYYDLAGIDNATAATWGEEQAERYLAFLRETFALLLDDP